MDSKQKQIGQIKRPPHVEAPEAFEGYTLDEIRHHRALMSVRKEFAKAKAFENLDALKDHNPFGPNSKMKAASRLGSLPVKLVKGLNYTDYIMLGLSTFSTARKLFSLFRKKKK